MEALFIRKSRDRWEIVIEGECWKEVHPTIFGKKPLFPPFKPDNLQEIFDAYETRRVKSYLLWLLSRQSYHSDQLKKMLREKLVQPKTIDAALDNLQKGGYLDDEGWLKSFIGTQKKRMGLPLIQAKLRAKGIRVNSVEFGIEDEGDAIRHLLETRYHSKDLSDFKIRQKVIASLMRKGFKYSSILNSFVN
jgi:regulatory protein